MRTSEFDYHLPPELIAQTPIEPRDASRLLVLHRRDGSIDHRHFRDIRDYLKAGDLLVANDSRVIPARIPCRKIPTGGRVELLLLSRKGERIWEALVGGRKVHIGTELSVGVSEAEVRGRILAVTNSGGRLVEFSEPIEPLLERLGVIPLPPYIHEPLADEERYQTVYARIQGSVAAPTAGLHFTPELMDELRSMGVEFAFVTLHIGLDTFRPVSEENIEEHRMHAEYCSLDVGTAERINRARAEKRRIIAVGTTTVRVLETAARGREEGVASFAGWTDLFIYPGFKFRVVDAMITNFHLPRSTLLMLVSAFAGKALIEQAYREAIEKRYRFYSFGDAMLIL